jgi:hypothetical protein
MCAILPALLQQNRRRLGRRLEHRGAGGPAWRSAREALLEANAADAALQEIERVAKPLRWLREKAGAAAGIDPPS